MENIHAKSDIKGMHGREILDVIKERYQIRKIGRTPNSPSFNYEIIENGYIFGLIDPHKHDFCEDCNRIRLTAEGHLIPCLYFEDAQSIAKAVKENNIEKASNILKDVLANKPKENRWGSENAENNSNRAFFETGG